MGEVYRARDTRLGREVAIKVLPADVSGDAERLKRFEKEARSASSLNHPSIVTIYDIGQADAVSYIAMELVEGKTLRDLMAGGPLPIKKLLQIGAQVTDGLARAHEAGIVHRDLKPENVMVTKDSLAKILDFGLAKLTRAEAGTGNETNLPTQTATTPGVVMGTVGYMSPEQAGGHPLDFRSDQFSFGAILYEMATGNRAFQRKSVVQTLAAIIQEEPEPVGASNPQVPVPLRWIIERCLAKEPEDRYASTKDLARELSTVRDRLGEASFSGAVPAAVTSRRSSLLRAAAPALALLVGIFGGILAGQPIWRARLGSQPTVRQITFRRATILNAFFAPDGQVVYAVGAEDQTKGNPGEVFSTRPGAFEPRSLGLPPGNVVSVSSTGELAILVGGFVWQGTLATVPLAGGAPRELLEDVGRASWSPDGKALAVMHRVNGKFRIEFPIGKVLYESSGWIGKVQFSPKGDLIAFSSRGASVLDSNQVGELTVMDLSGTRRKIGRGGSEFAWSPRGDEIWVNNYYGKTSTIEAVSLSGRRRRLASFPGDFAFHDVSRDGRVLLEGITNQAEIVGRIGNESAERNLSWLDGSLPADISADGKILLFSEIGQGGGPNHAVYKRGTDGSPAVRLGDGVAVALSPDGSWALSKLEGAPNLTLLPMGAGQERTVSLPPIQFSGGTTFFPDGKHLLLRGSEAGHETRLYVLDLESGKTRPITQEGVDSASTLTISPDGRTVASSPQGGKTILYDVEGGPPRPVPYLAAGLSVIKWCADGRSLFVRTSGNKTVRVYRLELASGRLELWREFSVTDIRTGYLGVIPTADGKSYVYGYSRDFSDLFIAEGIK